MSRIAVIYHSPGGTTRALAEAACAGAESVPETDAFKVEICGRAIVEGRYIDSSVLAQLDTCDALIFASPTFMGSVSAQFKAFMDGTSERYSERRWRDKLAAGITIGSSASGDQLHTIQTLQIFASQHGMLWTSIDLPANFHPQDLNNQGAQSGLIAHAPGGKVNSRDLCTAEYLGRRIALIAARLREVGVRMEPQLGAGLA